MLFGYETDRTHWVIPRKKCRLTGGIFAWESVSPTEKRIANQSADWFAMTVFC